MNVKDGRKLPKEMLIVTWDPFNNVLVLEVVGFVI